MGTKRPRPETTTNGVSDSATPHTKQSRQVHPDPAPDEPSSGESVAPPPPTDAAASGAATDTEQCNDCPICLEACSPHHSFQLDCCNRHLATDAARQRVHKTCLFSLARHALESAVLKGDKPITMTDERLRDLLKCPRCRTALPFQRTMKVTSRGGFHADIKWLDGTLLAEASVNAGSCHGVLRNERVLFFRTVLGAVTDLQDALRSDGLTTSKCYGIQQMLGAPTPIVDVRHPFFGFLAKPKNWGVTPQPPRDHQEPLLGVYQPPSSGCFLDPEIRTFTIRCFSDDDPPDHT